MTLDPALLAPMLPDAISLAPMLPRPLSHRERQRSLEEHERSVWHEAGHAIMALASGGSVSLVEVALGGVGQGRTRYRADQDAALDIALAGAEAERLAKGTPARPGPFEAGWRPEWARDPDDGVILAEARKHAGRRGPADLVQFARSHVRSVLHQNRGALREVASALAIYGSLTGDELALLVNVVGERTPAVANTAGATEAETARLMRMREVITAGQWRIECEYIPYVPAGPRPPLYVKATPRVGDNTIIDVEWAPPADWVYANVTDRTAARFASTDVGGVAYQVDTQKFYNLTAVAGDGTPTWTLTTDATAIFEHLGISGYYVYVSSVSEVAGFPVSSSDWVGVGLYPDGMRCAVTGLTPGQQYWFYVTSIGPGQSFTEGNPSTVVHAVAGGGAGDESLWTVTDLSASFVEGSEGSDGLWHYHVDLLWTSPGDGVLPDDGLYGFKHAYFYFAVGTLPAPPLTTWQYEDEWHGDRVPPGKEFDRVTDGSMTWPLRFATQSQLSPGTVIYVCMDTWSTTNGFGGSAHRSNVASCTVP